MELIPAIDILEGRVVRLKQGQYDQVTVYADDPVEQAKAFHQEGAKRLHVVDLDGARTGRPVNMQTIKAILTATPLRIELGGGIRDRNTAERWYDVGVDRVVLGTAAIKNPDMAERLCAEHPEGVVVAVDSRGGEVAVEGWQQGSGRMDHDLARQADAWGAAAILYTVIDRDGMSVGADVEATLALQRTVKATVIASGGIATLDDIVRLSTGGIRAAVCGRALYQGAFTLGQALQAARTPATA
jgi:phosphoribosylformimino-5-aminoimidazole carboxamide ribotide isomerase